MKTSRIILTLSALIFGSTFSTYAAGNDMSADSAVASSESGWVRLTTTECDYSILTDDLVSSAIRGNSASFPVIIEESTQTPGLYRLINPMKAYATTPVDCNIIIDATDPEHVTISKQSLGIDFGDGTVSIESLASHYADKGRHKILIEDAGYYGKLSNGEITFPTSESFLLWTGDDARTANRSGALRIVLPERVAAVEPTISRADYYLGAEYMARSGVSSGLTPNDINNQLSYNIFHENN